MTPDEVDQLERLQDLRDRAAEIAEQIKEIELDIASRYDVGVPLVGDDDEPVAFFDQPVKFSADAAEKLLSDVPNLLALIQTSEPRITAALARKYLPAETYAKCQVPNGQPKLKFL